MPTLPARIASLPIDLSAPWSMTVRGDYPVRSVRMSLRGWNKLLARAKNGDPEAEWEVASRYDDGCKDKRGKVIVRRSPQRAALWFRKAAVHGHIAAQNNLGVLLGSGRGARKNVREALTWLKKASRVNDSSAVQNVALTYRETGRLTMAVEWFRKSAKSGDGDALLQLGIHYYWGKGVRRDDEVAVRCFRKAARSKFISGYGKDDALFCLGLAYLEGRGIKQSDRKAVQCFKIANKDDDHQLAKRVLNLLADRSE